MTAGRSNAVAIVCGAGTLPFEVARGAVERGRRVVLFPLRGSADPAQVAGYPHHWISVGQVGRLTRLAHSEGCREMTFIGALVRPSVKELRPDFHALRLLPRLASLFRGGDAHLLAGIAKVFEERGFRVTGAEEFAPEILVQEGALGRRQPSEADRSDIVFGLAYLRAAGSFDVGQAVIVANRRILAVEAAEGTDQMLTRFADLRRAGHIKVPPGAGVLVKAPKPQQDRRLDLPSIGPGTVEHVTSSGLNGIAVVTGSAIVADATRTAQLADKADLFIVGVHDKTDSF
jgi:DUF1009 family protein